MIRFFALSSAVRLLSGLASAQTSGDFDRSNSEPKSILHELAKSAAAMPAVIGQAPQAAAPAPVVPRLPPGTKKELYKPFQEAYLNAVGRLQNPKCADLYGEGGADKFAGVQYRFLALGRPHLNDQFKPTVIGAVTHAEGAPPASVFINSEGPFLTTSMFVTGKSGFQTVDMGTNLRGADFGALLLLHELGHVVGKFGPDANDSELNRSYTEEVLKHCFR
jgi:hypothetical protein